MVDDSTVLPAGDLPINLSPEFQGVLNAGYKLDIDVAGIPFNLKPTQQTPWTQEVREDRRQMFDQSREQGEQSFGFWWLRSEPTFHNGADQLFSDSGSTSNADLARSRFWTSQSMDVFTTAGRITPKGQVTGTADTTVRAVAMVRSGINYVCLGRSDRDQLDFYAVNPFAFSFSTTIGEGGATVLDVATDSNRVFVAINNKIVKYDEAGTKTTVATLTFSLPVRLKYVKNRLILGHGPAIYEVDPDGSSVALGPSQQVFKHKAPSWQWSDFDGGYDGIYSTGYAGLRGEIYNITEKDNGAGSLVLAPAVLQMVLPTGEVPYAIMFYTGSLFVLGTSSGARVGGFTFYGKPKYGPLSFKLPPYVPVRALGGIGNIVYLGGDDGVYMLDLSRSVDNQPPPDGRFAWAHHNVKTSAVGQNYHSVVTTGVVGAPILVTVTSNHIETENADGSGNVVTSWFSWNTDEKKRLYYAVLRASLPVGGTDVVDVKLENYEGATQTFSIPATTTQTVFPMTCTLAPSAAYRATITMNNGTNTNFVNSIQFKALPQESRYPNIVLPVLMNDREQRSDGPEIGYPGFAADRLGALEALARNNTTVVVTNRVLNSSYLCQLRAVQFTQTSGLAQTAWKGKVAGTYNLVLQVVQ